MMTEPIFSGTAQIHIQGSEVLKFISLDENQVLFDVVGMSKPRIRVIDSRPPIKRKMKEIMQSKKVEELTRLFSQPARVTITKQTDAEVVVTLSKTRAKNPRHMLWVAVGINGAIPYYDYKKLEVQSFKKNSFALFSLYKRPTQKTPNNN